MNVTFPLPAQLTPAQASSIADKLIYGVEGIDGITVTPDGDAVELSFIADYDHDVVSKLVSDLAEEVMTARVRKTAVIRRHDVHVPDAPAAPQSPRRAARGMLHRAYEQMFLEVAWDLEAEERRYPALIERSLMDRSHYIDWFPQNGFLVDELPHDREALAAVRRGDVSVDEVRRSSPYMLNPAVCFQFYREFHGQEIGDQTIVVTASGDCFRHEAPWRVSNYRLPAFSMREIAWLAPAETSEELRTKTMERVWALFQELGFSGRIEIATDPIYHPEDSRIKQHQLLAQSKYELVAKLPGGGSSSIGSFNNMREAQCRKFDISSHPGSAAHSGCAAFGLERWIELTLDTHGLDAFGWPDRLRELVRKA
ncbi:hypothetical protein L0U85_08025 [Glycomyces sp. L485]|uniref:hypothetical protein n=1 Tax=Glycomyces sp. L485 TaxID=2909235 RepID=UPI001F4AF4BD|nr:hypothetical protein [Glycomyces sp. L485]MCH7230797.1 hypothetical protein [Glycomyces sp. L485]